MTAPMPPIAEAFSQNDRVAITGSIEISITPMTLLSPCSPPNVGIIHGQMGLLVTVGSMFFAS